jgi:hypothetical protein
MQSKRLAAAKRSAKRSNAIARQARAFKLLRKKEPVIPNDVLRALAASRLPPDPRAYNERLRELLSA